MIYLLKEQKIDEETGGNCIVVSLMEAYSGGDITLSSFMLCKEDFDWVTPSA